MSAPPSGSGQPYGPPYAGPVYYPPMNLENLLTKRIIWAANALGILLVYFAVLLQLASGDVNVVGFANFLAVTGGLIAALASVTGALGSKRTTDLQNLGLLLWAALFLTVSLAVIGIR